MSAASGPIPPHKFAEALVDLSLENLYMKAAEIQNSLSHLVSSNQELRPYADAGDRECAQAIEENEGTMQRMEERLDLLQKEVTNRGFPWTIDGTGESSEINVVTQETIDNHANGATLRDRDATDTQSVLANRNDVSGRQGGRQSQASGADEGDGDTDSDGIHL